MNTDIDASGVIRLIDPRTGRPFCAIQNGCVVVRVGHGADKHDCAVSIAELVRLSQALTSGVLAGQVDTANTLTLPTQPQQQQQVRQGPDAAHVP